MLEMTQLDHKDIWKIAKEIGKLLKSPSCNLNAQILKSDGHIKKAVGTLEMLLQHYKNTSSNPNEFVKIETLQASVQIFTYLNYCRNRQQRKLLELLEYLIYSESSKKGKRLGN